MRTTSSHNRSSVRKKPAAFGSTSGEQLLVGNIQFGAEVGKGGFGTVFLGLNLETGGSVAVKRISLHDIDKDDLAAIQSEINLLKNLNHENIVKYCDTVQTENYLHIILEYMENGSLAQTIKRFGGCLSESLVAMYIGQVLKGLLYLHDQGVLHRDIKGANILTSKEGVVKLADFGVAVRLGESQQSNSVVGTPYWMAPEIIEMSGCSTAADIWSVGCTVIELLCGKPPYFDLAPMAALFRIVQDDHPPIPEGISAACRDFLMKCFMKEPRLRGTASELLRHQWIVAARRRTEELMSAETEALRPGRQSRVNDYSGVDGDEDWDSEISDVAVGQASAKSRRKFMENQRGLISAHVSTTRLSNKILKLPTATKSPARHLLEDEDLSKKQIFSQVSGAQLNLFGEDEDDDHFDLELEIPACHKDLPTIADRLKHRLSIKLQEVQRENMHDLEFQDDFSEEDLEEVIERDYAAKQTQLIANQFAKLKPNSSHDVAIEACKELDQIFRNIATERRRQIVSIQNGLIPTLMEVIETRNSELLSCCLSLINTLLEDNKRLQENLSLVGFIPMIVRILSSSYFSKAEGAGVRLEAAQLISNMCLRDPVPLQVFIACGGLPVLVGLLEADIDRRKLIQVAITGIRALWLTNDSKTLPKNDTCRIFAKLGLIAKLINVYKEMLSEVYSGASDKQHPEDDKCWSESDLSQVCDVFVLFSQGDAEVKQHMAEPLVLQGILGALHPKDFGLLRSDGFSQHVLRMLKCLRNLSMDLNALDHLSRAGAIPTLVLLLQNRQGPRQQDIQSHIIHAMYYLYQINKSRQSRAAEVGIIPELIRVVEDRTPMKQLAMQMIMDMAHAFPIARQMLKLSGAATFFISQFSEKYWKVIAVNSLSAWLAADTTYLEEILLAPANLCKLVTLLRDTHGDDFEQILQVLLDMVTKSNRLKMALSRSSLFVLDMINRLQNPKAKVRKDILVLFTMLVESSSDPSRFASEFNLFAVVQNCAQEQNQILVQAVAKNLELNIACLLAKIY